MCCFYRNAITEWLPEFFIQKEAWGPITKPHPAVTSKKLLYINYSFLINN